MTLEQRTGLTSGDLALIRQAAGQEEAIEKLILFGSRAKGSHRRGSDVDLAVQGNRIGDQSLSLLTDQLNEVLPLPYYFDVLNYEDITDPDLKAHIDRVGLVIYERQLSKPSSNAYNSSDFSRLSEDKE